MSRQGENSGFACVVMSLNFKNDSFCAKSGSSVCETLGLIEGRISLDHGKMLQLNEQLKTGRYCCVLVLSSQNEYSIIR